MQNEKSDALLSELKERLQMAVEANLESLVLYGSAAANDFDEDFSDLNVLCLLKQLDGGTLARLAPVVKWWQGKGQPLPMIFTLEELRRSADVFAIELYDIKEHHRVLHGPDHISALQVPMELHRVEVEREFRVNLIRLRQQYMAVAQDKEKVRDLMAASISTFLTLFRHARIALRQPAPGNKREAVAQMAESMAIDAAAFEAILNLRGDRKNQKMDCGELFNRYLQGLDQVVAEVDRRLS